jgi:hypothetical protein
MEEVIAKVLISGFAAVYALYVGKSLFRGEILFVQGRGAVRENSPKQYYRFAIYHALISGIFIAIAICSWLFL